MALTPSSQEGKAGGVTELPDLATARPLIRRPWGRIEVPGGTLRHRSSSFSGAWSTSSFLISSAADVLLHVKLYETAGHEYFSLRFGDARSAWCSSHIKSARPAFSPVAYWPPDILIPPALWSEGPVDGSIGLGSPIEVVRDDAQDWVMPIQWCLLRVNGSELTFYADDDIPLNVGIASGGLGTQVRRALRTATTVTL
jgi:hypothetical protein